MEKVIKDGKVAVLYSPDYGSGWYTWNKEYPDMIFDPTMVHYVLAEKVNEAKAYATLKWPEAYVGGNVDDLRVEWVYEGVEFRITEYDGNEDIEFKASAGWLVA